MVDQSMPESGMPGFAVPISDVFAQATAHALKDVRELAANGFPDDPEFDVNSAFRRDETNFRSISGSVGEARLSMHGMILNVVGLSWDNALDHIRALEHDVIMKPPPVWSPLTLSRSVMESCLFLHYLLDPAISSALRLARCAGLWQTDLQHMEKTARAFGPDQEASIAETKEYITDCLSTANVTERFNSTGKLIGYEVDGQRSGLDINLTEHAAKAMPSDLPAPYRILSGAAHGRPWMISRARDAGQDAAEGLTGEAATLMTAALVAIGSLDMALTAWQGYFGVELCHTLELLAERRSIFFHEAIGLLRSES